MPKPPSRPYWESSCSCASSPIHRRVLISKNASYDPAKEAHIVSRTSTGNASFTSASITRKEIPQLHSEDKGEIVRSVENIYNKTHKRSTTNTKMLYKNYYNSGGLVRNFSHQAKNQVHGSLSEPFSPKLNTTGDANIHHRQNSAQQKFGDSVKRSSSVRRGVSAISTRLHFATKSSIDESESEPPEPHAFAPSTSDDSFDDDPEFIELQEREQIVDKYERGSEQTNVDPWENPDFEHYKAADRYGFVHKEDELINDQLEAKKKQKEIQRERKWLKMLEEWKQRHPEKLPRRIWKGIPGKLRLVIWMRLLGIAELKATSRDNLYQELLMRARLVSKDVKQIDLDINRTYRDHVNFRKRYDQGQQHLFNVLTAYAMMNTEVGYCQGMSQIAAIFLMYMDEEDTFWSLHALLTNRKYTMHGFFVPGFPKLQRFQNHYDKVLLKYLPRVRKHLENTGIPPIYLTKWWFGCFLDRIPFSLALRLWDVFLYHGDSILIAMSLNIMKMHRRTILKLNMEDFMQFIQTSLAEDFGYPDDKVMESLEECLKRLQSDRMALPPPPNPRDPSEVPTKPLGPILTRSMLDIRSDIAEVYSRCSRANSLAGRSPAVHKRTHYNQKMIATATARAFSNVNRTTTAAPSSPNERKESFDGREIVSPPVEPFLRRVGSTKDRRNKPPPVPDEDGFVRMSPRQPRIHPTEQQPSSTEHAPSLHKRQISQYDNVNNVVTASPLSNTNTTTTTTSKSISSSSTSSHPRSSSLKNQRAPIIPSVFAIEHRREVSTISRESQRHRVHRIGNNITVVQLEESEDAGNNTTSSSANLESKSSRRDPPYCPPPDYPGATAADMMVKGNSNNETDWGNGKNRRRGEMAGRHGRTARSSSEKYHHHQYNGTTKQPHPMARPLYSRDETTIIRRF